LQHIVASFFNLPIFTARGKLPAGMDFSENTSFAG
jgi:hypothetical protein